MRIFNFDASHHADAFASQDWVHIADGVTPEFLGHLREVVQKELAGLDLAGHRGAKDQFVYAPPDDVDLRGELFAVVGAVCGLDPSELTLSECHINVYDADAPPEPPAHKDRVASQVTLGITIDSPDPSSVVLYPYSHREVNPYFMTAELRESLDPEELPEVILRGARSVEIRDHPGDVVVFPGSSMWHLRRNSADTVNLYLKCNALHCDPLGEDPTTRSRRLGTEALLAAGGGDLGAVVPARSAQLEWTGCLSGVDGLERLFAKIWNQRPFPLSEVDRDILRAVDGRTDWELLAAKLDVPRADSDQRLLRLARRGALDLLGARTGP